MLHNDITASSRTNRSAMPYHPSRPFTLLLQDNFTGHIVPGGLQNICIKNFTPNLTAHVQPMDQGIIRCFKAHYHWRFINEAVNCHDRGKTASYIYDTNQLEAMCMAALAWDEVDATTIKNCWGKANILPYIDHPIIQPAISISSVTSVYSGMLDLWTV